MTQKKIERLNLILRTVRNVNQLLVKERDRTRLLQGICDTLTKNRGYYNAWIAQFDDSGQLVETAESGLGSDFQPLFNQMKKGELTSCGKKALSRPDAVLVEDPPSFCQDCPLAKKYKGRSGIAIRLAYDNKVYGLLGVSVPNEFLLDKEEHDLLGEISEDIAFGLYSIETEEERQKTESALQESERSFRDLIENSLTGISIIQDNQVIYRNPEQQKLLGDRPLLFTDNEHLHPEDVAKVKSFYQGILSGEKPQQGIEFRFFPLGKAGSREDMKWVHCRVNFTKYKGKDAILVNLTDIKKTKELERLLAVQDKMSSLGRVAAGIAHEIRNPLSGINIYLNALEKLYDFEREGHPEKVQEIIKQLKSASHKIDSVIKRVMDFSKPSEPSFVQTNINRPVKEAIDLSSVTLRKSGVTIEYLPSDDLAPCKADPQLITQVVLNLITNASEAMKNLERGKQIRVSTYMDNEQVTIGVSDSGPGVPSLIREKVFDPFYTTKDWSTGIGLSLCHRIISDHGGSIEIHEGKLGGAEFRVSIPPANKGSSK